MRCVIYIAIQQGIKFLWRDVESRRAGSRVLNYDAAQHLTHSPRFVPASFFSYLFPHCPSDFRPFLEQFPSSVKQAGQRYHKSPVQPRYGGFKQRTERRGHSATVVTDLPAPQNVGAILSVVPMRCVIYIAIQQGFKFLWRDVESRRAGSRVLNYDAAQHLTHSPRFVPASFFSYLFPHCPSDFRPFLEQFPSSVKQAGQRYHKSPVQPRYGGFKILKCSNIRPGELLQNCDADAPDDGKPSNLPPYTPFG